MLKLRLAILTITVGIIAAPLAAAPVTLVVDQEMPPPGWALLERALLRTRPVATSSAANSDVVP